MQRLIVLPGDGRPLAEQAQEALECHLPDTASPTMMPSEHPPSVGGQLAGKQAKPCG